MNKQQFNNLEITKQIQYINSQLELISLTKVCENIGIDRATIRKRFKSKGYTLVDNKYIATDTDTKKANNSNSKNVKSTNNINISLEQYNSLEKRIKDIEKQLKKLSNNNTTNTQLQQSNNKEIKFYKNETVVRAYRVDTDIQQRFKEYCSKNNQYKISDIISTALENFLNEYDK
ncbi:hypothetical protein LHU00_003959 [Clostridioides difficile]|nr:hypothetical protein [Clostridioides difficile]EII6798544.1 hypothetical protein [Clostridioides difficile]